MACFTRALSSLTFFFLSMALPQQAASASTVRMTMYADGKSCPGNCDAHVVFDGAMNGTEFAHLPRSDAKPFKACTKGAECEICLESGLRQCVVAMYRGAGPSKNTFDLTPAFYERRCAMSDSPPLLKAKCKELEKAAAVLKDRVNCIKDSGSPACKAIVDDARSKQSADLMLYDKCKTEGEANFNSGKPEEQRRFNDCAYEFKGTGGPNSKGTTWKKLLPGACRAGTYVGRDGTDCCSGTIFADGPLHTECRAFYPKKS